ncbi:MAG TPA: hypothetical protein PLX88_05770 [Syntrophorhabdaceae bacterium]|jgi:hypothetical protein|nr:hypothetical protein [Syntrophorhabdaceae bacterium]MDI9562096.1 hypothetical protein [Pseudomonadota bacterium]OQC49112.1 MAG: hypothetical protein BWX58_00829 [Deltaproteobacteria bacterium ADurb.Bin026]MBP8698966.1 hypothetical protein [Syntrophorhabdaceae bacterium]MBV6505590.1 hypothetical protein [Syntrophorhabdaceae bacterium]
MINRKKRGIVLIFAGVLLPAALLYFITGYQEGAGFFKNLFGIKIQVSLFSKYRFGIPYRFFVALGVILVFLGIKSFDIKGLTPDNSEHNDGSDKND